MKRKVLPPILVTAAALMLAGTVPSACLAEQGTAGPSSTAAAVEAKPGQMGHILAPAPAKPARKDRNSKSSQSARADSRPWSINDALPKDSKALSIGETEPKPKTELGRIPLQSGSVGFETKTKVNTTEYPDGQRLPGADTAQHQPPSYLGLSLSLPTNKSMLPPFLGGGD